MASIFFCPYTTALRPTHRDITDIYHVVFPTDGNELHANDGGFPTDGDGSHADGDVIFTQIPQIFPDLVMMDFDAVDTTCR